MKIFNVAKRTRRDLEISRSKSGLSKTITMIIIMTEQIRCLTFSGLEAGIMMQHLVAFIFITIIIRCSMMTTHGLEQCQVQSVSIYGYYLTDHVIYTKTCASLSECVILCSYEFRCKSFNFRLMDKLCELNDADRFTHPVEYVPMEGFLYKDTTERHRKVSCHLANVRTVK